jgi:ATPase subunit of ABC transporter with duplicated ATPase domains
MITFSQFSMAYGNKLLFYDVSLILNNNTRYALVGANGSGKSTFFKLMTGEIEAASGNVFMPKDITLGVLKQDQFRYEDSIIVDIVLQGKPLLWKALSEKEKLLSSNTWTDDVGHRLGELEEIISHQNGYTANAFAEKLLTGLGIQAEYHYQPLKSLSGGFKLRVLLAQTLFQEPNVLLLDEPTNHLDILSIHWLEKYLKNEFQGLLVFISHDIQFINRLADTILDIDYGEIKPYSGNYQKFLNEKKLVQDQMLQVKKLAEQKISHMQQFIDRLGAKASKAKQAQSRMKMIEKIEIPDIKHSSRISPHFNFKQIKPTGKKVLQTKNLSKKYQTNIILQRVYLEIYRGEKVAITGVNGIGKSTLIKTLLNIVPHDEGEIEWINSAKISYFSQDHHDKLKTRQTMLSWMRNQITDVTELHIRKALANVLFTKDDVEKDILTLSGGEAARVLLAQIMLESPNIIVLDEPTNHMDIETIDSLADALNRFEGTLIFVSHNRYFIDKIANRILFIDEQRRIKDFKGKYSDFEAQND